MSAPLVDLGGHAVNIGNSSVEPPLTQDATTILLETIAAIIGGLGGLVPTLALLFTSVDSAVWCARGRGHFY